LFGRNLRFEWPHVQVGVEKVTLNGRVRITLKPLMDEMPIVAAMQVRPFHRHLLIYCLVKTIISITITTIIIITTTIITTTTTIIIITTTIIIIIITIMIFTKTIKTRA